MTSVVINLLFVCAHASLSCSHTHTHTPTHTHTHTHIYMTSDKKLTHHILCPSIHTVCVCMRVCVCVCVCVCVGWDPRPLHWQIEPVLLAQCQVSLWVNTVNNRSSPSPPDSPALSKPAIVLQNLCVWVSEWEGDLTKNVPHCIETETHTHTHTHTQTPPCTMQPGTRADRTFVCLFAAGFEHQSLSETFVNAIYAVKMANIYVLAFEILKAFTLGEKGWTHFIFKGYLVNFIV